MKRRSSKKPGWLFLLLLQTIQADVLRKARVTVKEGTQRNELILDLVSAGQRLFPSDNIKRTFVQSTKNEIFDISQNGQVRLSQDLDREALCGKDDECVFTSIISVLPQRVYQKIAVEVTIKDENDNAPQFNSSGLIAIELDENVEIGAKIEMNQLRATDADPGLFGDVKYELSSGAKFRLVDDDFRTFLIPEAELDREQEPEWVGTVVATDGGGRQAQTRVKVTLRDDNDNAPRFTGTRFVASVSEDKQPGTFVYQVEAADADAGQNADITYELLKTEPSRASTLFAIDAKSGYITTQAAIDREQFETIILTIGASDNGQQQLMAQCQVTVTVTDQNDHAPQISITHVNSAIINNVTLAIVNENEDSGTFVSFITVTDGDIGQNGNFIAAVKPKDKFQLIADDIEGSLILVTKKPFDREQNSMQNVTITACDKGTPKKCSSVALPILIGDVNDNPPVFASPVIRLSIVENLSIGTEVALVEAEDKDSKELYGKITYALDGFGANDFIIDETTGQVKVDRVIDYESQQSYNLTVIATDAGGLEARSELKIEVQNLNDNLPSIKAADVVYLDSSLMPGDMVIDLEPFDRDGPVPIVTMSGVDAHRFVLDGSKLLLDEGFNGDKDSLIRITVRDADNLASVVEYELQILAPRSYALIGAGIGCAIVLVIIIGCVLVMKHCNYEKYKLQNQFNSLARQEDNAQNQKMMNADNYSRSDYIITYFSFSINTSDNNLIRASEKTAGSNSDCSNLDVRFGRKTKMDSDSGRGESESETHSRNVKLSNTSVVHLGDWCQTECLTLGHSDQCWLPQIVATSSQSAYEVDVSPNVASNCMSSLSVWDKTSDYSSHSNRSSDKQSHKTKMHTSKPCFV